MNLQTVLLIFSVFLVCGLIALSTLLIVPTIRHQAVLNVSRATGMSHSDTHYLHSITSSLAEILKRILPLAVPAVVGVVVDELPQFDCKIYIYKN